MAIDIATGARARPPGTAAAIAITRDLDFHTKEKPMRIALMISACLLAFQFSRPAEANPCSGVTCTKTTVQRLYPASNVNNPRVYVRPTDGGQASLDCTAVSGVYLTLKTSHPLFGEIFDALLEATIHDKSVTLRIKEDSTDCEILYIVVENP
jgi:hypothetical protein